MKALALAACFLALSASAARPSLTAAELQDVGLDSPSGARVPIDSQWKSDSGANVSLGAAMAGWPTVLVFADYTCGALCGPVLTFAADALAKSGLAAQDYRFVALGIDPKDGPREASSMKRERIVDEGIASAAVFLTGGEAVIRQTAEAAGYRFAYDAANDQFAHPAAILVVAPDGRIVRALSGLGVTPDGLRLALVEASEGRIGTWGDRVRLLCYGFDPSVGLYMASIYRALAIASAMTVIMLAAGIAWLSFHRPRAS